MIVAVAGTKAMGIDLSDIRPGDPVDLVAEPDNPHDANAVRVHHRGRLVGYLPAAIVARFALAHSRASIAQVLFFEGRPSGLRVKVEAKART